MRRSAACALAVLALLLGAAACGESRARSRQDAAAAARAATHWRAGLTSWHRQMLHALDGLSLLFSTRVSVSEMTVRHTHAFAALGTFEQTLAACSSIVRRLGPEPAGFEPSRRYALQACGSLEQGEREIEAAIAGMAPGVGPDLSRATGPLSDGQNELAVVASVLRDAHAAS
jgi:hypothetical protein